MRLVRDKARLYLNDVLWGERELSTPCAACTVQARVACVPVPVYTASAAVRPERALAKIRLSASEHKRRGDFDYRRPSHVLGVHCARDSPKKGGCEEPKIRCGHNTELGVAISK